VGDLEPVRKLLLSIGRLRPLGPPGSGAGSHGRIEVFCELLPPRHGVAQLQGLLLEPAPTFHRVLVPGLADFNQPSGVGHRKTYPCFVGINHIPPLVWSQTVEEASKSLRTLVVVRPSRTSRSTRVSSSTSSSYISRRVLPFLGSISVSLRSTIERRLAERSPTTSRIRAFSLPGKGRRTRPAIWMNRPRDWVGRAITATSAWGISQPSVLPMTVTTPLYLVMMFLVSVL